MNASVKMLGHLPAHELIFWRSIISFSISYAFLKHTGISILGNNLKWLMIRGIAGTIALFFFFMSLRLMPLATASTVQYLSPIFTVLYQSSKSESQTMVVIWLGLYGCIMHQGLR
jgi:drug/metabolite transporter (DMT)-like permease